MLGSTETVTIRVVACKENRKGRHFDFFYYYSVALQQDNTSVNLKFLFINSINLRS